MLYQLSQWLGEFPGSGLWSYISFRAAGAAITAFLLAVLFGPGVIRWLSRLGIGERIDGTGSAKLEELHQKKKGTPTMGGVFLIGALLLSCLLWLRFDAHNRFSWPAVLLVAGFAGVGLLDDWVKLTSKKRGISARHKQGLLTVLALGVGLWLLGPAALERWAGGTAARGTGGAVVAIDDGYGLRAEPAVADRGGPRAVEAAFRGQQPEAQVPTAPPRTGPRLYVPLFKDLSFDLTWALGIPFLLLAILVLTGAANAVNLTDGMDGLAIGCVITSAIAYAGITYFVGHERLSQYLLVAHVPGSGEMTVLLGALLGSALGFLWFNAAPAMVFMGDVGSLGLGGALGFAALVSRTELVLFVVGGVFVATALSVALQVLSFKLTGKRIFRCAPLHHHFQFAGVPDTRIVTRTWIVSALLALCSLALFKVR